MMAINLEELKKAGITLEDVEAEIARRKGGASPASPSIGDRLKGGATGFLQSLAGVKPPEPPKPESLTDQLITRSKLVEAARNTGNRPLFDLLTGATNEQTAQAVLPQINSTAPQTKTTSYQQPEIDPFTKELTALGIEQEAKNKALEAAETKRAQKETEMSINKEELARSIEGILALESTIPRSEEGGFDRFKQGFQNKLASISQGGLGSVPKDIAENIATYQSEIDLITPKLARASGDVANIAVAERKFSKEAFASLSDTKGTSAKKRAFLVQFTKAINNNSADEIKKILDAQKIPYFDLSKNSWVNLDGLENEDIKGMSDAELEALAAGG